MQNLTRTPRKLRRHEQEDGYGVRRQPRPAARRQGTRAAAVAAAIREA